MRIQVPGLRATVRTVSARSHPRPRWSRPTRDRVRRSRERDDDGEQLGPGGMGRRFAAGEVDLDVRCSDQRPVGDGRVRMRRSWPAGRRCSRPRRSSAAPHTVGPQLDRGGGAGHGFERHRVCREIGEAQRRPASALSDGRAAMRGSAIRRRSARRTARSAGGSRRHRPCPGVSPAVRSSIRSSSRGSCGQAARHRRSNVVVCWPSPDQACPSRSGRVARRAGSRTSSTAASAARARATSCSPRR